MSVLELSYVNEKCPQEDGSGAADASQSEGHDSKLMARMSSQKQRQKNTQVSVCIYRLFNMVIIS